MKKNLISKTIAVLASTAILGAADVALAVAGLVTAGSAAVVLKRKY